MRFWGEDREFRFGCTEIWGTPATHRCLTASVSSGLVIDDGCREDRDGPNYNLAAYSKCGPWPQHRHHPRACQKCKNVRFILGLTDSAFYKGPHSPPPRREGIFTQEENHMVARGCIPISVSLFFWDRSNLSQLSFLFSTSSLILFVKSSLYSSFKFFI